MTECESLFALAPFLKENTQSNPRIVLAGDTKQLHYTPRSQAASLGGLTIDLMTRLMDLEIYLDNRFITHLVEIFRNDQLITTMLNKMVY